MEKHERLRQARIRAGFASAAAAAQRLGVPYGTYSGHENGLRGVKDREALRYAKAFGVTPNWLIFGDEEEEFGIDESALFQMGSVGGISNGEVELVKDKNDVSEAPAFAVEPFFPSYSMFIHVNGPHLRGIADEGSYIICSASFDAITTDHINHLCLCRFENMKILIRTVRHGRIKNRFDLEAPLFPLMQDQKIRDASLVYGILLPHMVAKISNGPIFLPSYDGIGVDFPDNSSNTKKNHSD